MHPHRPSRTVAPCAEFPNDNPALHSGAIWRCSGVNEAASWEPAPGTEGPLPSDAVDAPLGHEPTPTEPMVYASQPAAEPPPVDEPMALAIEPAAEPMVVAEPERPEVGEEQPAGSEEEPDDDYEIDVVDDLGFDEDVVEEALQACTVDATGEDPGATLCSDDPFARLREVVEDVARAMGGTTESAQCVHALLGGARLDASTISPACADALVAGGQLEADEHGLRRAEGFAREVLAWQGILRGESDDFGACGAAMLDEWCANLLARAMGNPSRAETLRRELRRRGVAAFGLVADAA